MPKYKQCEGSRKCHINPSCTHFCKLEQGHESRHKFYNDFSECRLEMKEESDKIPHQAYRALINKHFWQSGEGKKFMRKMAFGSEKAK